MERISLVVFAAQANVAATLENQLSETADVAEVVSKLEALAVAVHDHAPGVVFAHLGSEPREVLEALAKLPSPQPILVVAGPQDDSALILAAMRIGVREFLPPNPEVSVVQTLFGRLSAEVSDEDVQRPAPVVAVIGAKGGVGATFVACQLAGSLQESGSQCAIVDLNAPLGDVALHLDIQPAFTIANAAADSGRLDATSLRSILQPHSMGLQVLAASNAIEQAKQVRPEHIQRVLQVLRQEVAWVVVDVPHSWSDETVTALDLADQILVVATSDFVVLSHTRSYLELLKKLGFDSKVRLILNHDSKGRKLTDAACKEFLGQPPDTRLPEDPNAETAVNEGELLSSFSRRGPLRKAFSGLALDVYGWCEVDPPVRQSGFRRRLARMFRRSRDVTD
jgi:pilus assembly protein CpaE